MRTVAIYHNLTELHRNDRGSNCGAYFDACGQCRFELAYSYDTDMEGAIGPRELQQIFRENQNVDGDEINVVNMRRSLSVGDVIEVGGEQWKVDTFGFSPIRLHPSQIQ